MIKKPKYCVVYIVLVVDVLVMALAMGPIQFFFIYDFVSDVDV